MRIQSFEHFPVAFFSIVMGLTGFAISLQKATSIFSLSAVWGEIVLLLSGIVFLAVSIGYLIKLIRWPAAVRAEFLHPIKIAFFPTISISLLLFAIAFLAESPGLSKILWLVGSSLHLIFTLVVISVWMRGTQFEIKHMNPAWFIPAVGNIIVPIVGVVHAPIMVSWFFFIVGFMFWVILLVVFFYRVIFHHPLPDRLVPTVAILLAPPAVGAIALAKLVGGVFLGVELLYCVAVFFFLVVVAQSDLFLKLRFYLSWWAYSFPLAAFAIATSMLAEHSGGVWVVIAAKALLVCLSIIILLLIVATVRAVLRAEICVAEE